MNTITSVKETKDIYYLCNVSINTCTDEILRLHFFPKRTLLRNLIKEIQNSSVELSNGSQEHYVLYLNTTYFLSPVRRDTNTKTTKHQLLPGRDSSTILGP